MRRLAQYAAAAVLLALLVPSALFGQAKQPAVTSGAFTGNASVQTNSRVCLNGATCTVYVYFDGTNSHVVGSNLINDSGGFIVGQNIMSTGSYTVNALKVPVVHGSGTANQALENATGAFTAGAATVTFTTAFGAAPNCVCNTTSATVPCSIATPPSTTAVGLAGTGTDTYWVHCTGQR